MNPIESRLKESIERGDRRGRLGNVADEMHQLLHEHIPDSYRAHMVFERLLRYYHRFAQVALEEQNSSIEDFLQKSLVRMRRVCLLSIFCGAWLGYVAVNIGQLIAKLVWSI